MRGIWHRLHEKLLREKNRSPVVSAILTLMTGTMISQIVIFIFQIFINRIYTDYEKGLFRISGTITSFVIAVAALRFDVTQMLPKSDTVARVLKKIATRSIVVSSFLTSLFCIIFSKFLEDRYHQSQELSKWLMISGLTVFLVAEITNIQYWLTRKERFGALASNQVLQSTSIVFFQLIMGLLWKGGLVGLITGTIMGQLVGFVAIKIRTPELRGPIPDNAPSMLSLMRRYRKMPLLNGPNVLVDSVRNMGINLLIGSVAVAALGQFQLAWAIMQVPVGLIAGSVSQVFLKKLAVVEHGKMSGLVRFTLIRAAFAAIGPFALLFVLAPWLFPFVFGAQWDQAGYFAQALTPWLYMTVLTSPISNIFVVTENQRRMLIFAVLYCVVPLLWLWFSPLTLLPTVFALGGLMALMLGVMLLLAWKCAVDFDRKPPASESSIS